MVDTGALTGRRLSTVEWMNYRFTQTVPPAPWDISKNNYVFVPYTGLQGGTGYLYAENFFDFGGYVQDDLTVFPERISVQESGSFRMSADDTSQQEGAFVIDVISEERIIDFDTLVSDVVVNESSPGFNKGPLEFQQIIYGRYRRFANDTAIFTDKSGNLTMINETSFGSGSPTTARKLWCTRIIIPLGNYEVGESKFIVIPAARYIMSFNVDKEGDNEYLMRLKRSYELAQ